MTGRVRVHPARWCPAAMEPALGERDDGMVPVMSPGDQPAAMEPALGERDDLPVGPASPGNGLGPQWSPLLVSGMTLKPLYGSSRMLSPQWSPLLVSGMTCHDFPAVAVLELAAMEPALGERDDFAGGVRA